MGLTNAPRTSQFSRNAYLETLHANEAAPDHGIISDAGLRPSDRDIVRSTQDMLVMADAYRLQLWRLDLAVRDTKARVDIRKVAPELIGESAENVLQLLSIERHGELVFDDRWTLVFYELFKGDIPWIRLVLLHRLKSLEWLLGGVVDWDLYAPELLTSAST
ncbi:MAG: hypothetical protein Q8M66_06075, partial [Actinomycetota bacterium]|nr:hypothetical protein [Actinomycetota bacterium]